MTFSATSLSLTADNAGISGLSDESIRITVTNRPTGGIWSRVTVTGAALVAGTVNWPAPGDGRLHLDAWPPGSLGAGTYTATVKVEVCSDAQCANQVSGSPMNIAVTYIVTGSALPTTRLYWNESILTGAELTTAETRAPTMTLQISSANMPPDGIYLRHTNSATGLITGMVFGQPSFSPNIGVAYGQYAVTLKPPAALGSGIFTDSVQLSACFDAACTQPVPNSNYTLSFRLLIPVTDGVEITRHSMTPAHGGTDLVWSVARQLLYVASSENASNGSFAGADPLIVAVDPVTMTQSTGPALNGENLRHIAVTDDGAYLYVGSRTQPTIHRLTLPSMAPDLDIPLGAFSAFEPYLDYDMATLPGQPQSLLVSVSHNNSQGGVRVYDGSTPRADVVLPAQDFEYARWLVPGAAAGTFISQSYGPSNPKFNNLDVLAVDSNGVHVSNTSAVAGDIIAGTQPQRAGNRLFLPDGRILDTTTGALLGALALPDSTTPHSLLVDEAHGRVFVWMEVSQRSFIVSFDLATLKPLAYAPVYAPGAQPGASTRMVLWGSNGVALVDGNQLIVFSGTFFSTYRGEPTLSTPPSSN